MSDLDALLLNTHFRAAYQTQANHFITKQLRFEERYQQVIAQYYQAQAAFLNAQRETDRLRNVVQVKQGVIQGLLPYYPHPLTPELQAAIALV